MNKSELATEMGVSRPTIDRWLSFGCPVYKNGRSYDFDLEEVEQWRRDNIGPSYSDYDTVNGNVSHSERIQAVNNLFAIIRMLLPYVDWEAFIHDVESGNHRKLPAEYERRLSGRM